MAADTRSTTELDFKVQKRELSGLGRFLDRLFDTRRTRAFNRGMREVRRALNDNVRETENLVRAMAKVERGTDAYKRMADRLREVNREAGLLRSSLANLGGAGGGGGGGGGGRRRLGGGRGVAWDLLTSGGRAAPAMAKMGLAELGTGLMAGAGVLSAETGIGLAIGGLIGAIGLAVGGFMAAQQTFQSYTRQQQVQMQAAPFLLRAGGPSTGRITRGFGAAGIPFGVAPQEALMQAAVMSQAMYRPAEAPDLTQALAYRQRFGIGVGQSAGFRGALGRVQYGRRSNAGGRQNLALAIETARGLGLEAGEIPEFLQQQTGFMQQLASRGTMMDSAQLLSAAEAMGSIGIRGFRTMPIATAFAGNVEQMGRTGIQGAADVRMMRALGWTGRGGAEEYARIMNRAQNPRHALAAMPDYIEQFIGDYGIDPNSELATMVTQRALRRRGVEIGVGEARRFVQGTGDLRQAMASSWAASVSGETLDRITTGRVDEAKALAGRTGGAIIRQAEIEAKRIEAGAKVAKVMLEMAESTAIIANIWGNTLAPVSGELAEQFKKLLSELKSGSDPFYGRQRSLFGLPP